MEDRLMTMEHPAVTGDPMHPAVLDALLQAREEKDSIQRAAGETIRQVLSRDSQQFLRDARQYGGE